MPNSSEDLKISITSECNALAIKNRARISVSVKDMLPYSFRQEHKISPLAINYTEIMLLAPDLKLSAYPNR